MISKAYKKKAVKRESPKYKESAFRSGKDEERPFTPYTSEPSTPTIRAPASIVQSPSIIRNPMKHLQPMDTYRTSHGPVHVNHTSNRRLSMPSTTENILHVDRSPPVSEKVQSATYYNSLRSTALPKLQRPLPPRIKSIQFQQQQRMLRLVKEDEDINE